MSEKQVDVDALVETVCDSHVGCKMKSLPTATAQEFVDKATEKARQGTKVNITLTKEILEEKWGFRVTRDTIRLHFRGKCACQRK